MSYTITATKETWLKKPNENGQILQSSQLSENLKSLVSQGKEWSVVGFSEDKINGHIKVDLNYGAGTWYIFPEHWILPWEENQEDDIDDQIIFTEAQLKYIMPHADPQKIKAYLNPLNKACNRADILSTNRACAFIAQLAHESGSFNYFEEIANGSAYEGRKDLGNIYPGDGRRFKGRGPIQLTGRTNYGDAGEDLELPLLENPEMVSKNVEVGFLTSTWFWKTRNLNHWADQGDFKRITRIINGGYNGLQDRLDYWERAKAIMANPVIRAVPKTWQEINWNEPQAKVSEFFTVREVTLGDPRRIPRDSDIKQNIFNLAKQLDQIREDWGSPILINSWYRPPAINNAVGGAANSQHLYGSAVDVRPGNQKLLQLQKWLDLDSWKDRALGYGVKKGFVHLDTRSGRIRWNY